MNWKHRISPVSCIIFVILIAEIIGVLFVYKNYKFVSKQLDQVSLRILELQNGLPLSSLSQITTQTEEYAREAVQLIGMLPQFPTQTVTPQFFQDKLRDQVSAVIAKASDANVAFPPNFYLGFDAYRATLPPQDIAFELDRELEIVFTLVSQLIDSRIFSISTLYRFPSVEESSATLQSPQSLKQPRIFDLCFISDQQALRGILNFILKFPHLISIEAMQVISSASVPPKKHEADTKQSGVSQSEAHAAIRLLFEKEKLMVTLRIAIPAQQQASI